MNEELLELAERLKAVERELTRHFVHLFDEALEVDNQAFNAAVSEFRELKKRIRISALEQPTFKLPGAEHEDARSILQRVLLGEPLDLESTFGRSELGITVARILRDELSREDEERLIDEMELHFLPYDYLNNLYTASALIVGAGTIPEHLSRLVWELRDSLVYGHTLAVVSLCRSTLEVAVRDRFIDAGLQDPYSERRQEVERWLVRNPRRKRYVEDYDPDLFGMIVMLTVLDGYSDLRDRLHHVRIESNRVIHGSGDVSMEEARELTGTTLRLVHELYEQS